MSIKKDNECLINEVIVSNLVAAMVKRELSERGGSGPTEATALETTAAISGGTMQGRWCGPRLTASTSPDTTGPGLGRSGERVVAERSQLEPAIFEHIMAWISLDCGPDGEGAVVDYCQNHGSVGGCGNGEEWEDRER